MEGPPLRIRLLGSLDLRLGEAAVKPLESSRAESLLTYLLLHREAPQSRAHLAFLLWPDSTEPQARTNLRHVLHTLRHALPDPDRYLAVTPRTLQWRPDAPMWLDVASFDEAVTHARDAPNGEIDALRHAVELYRGDLLQGSYDDWLLGERERLHQHFLTAIARLTELLEARGDHAETLTFATQLLRHDPLHEETYRLLMRLHAARGDRAAALRVYHACTATLERELGIEPSAPTREAYEALLPAVERSPEITPQVGRVSGPPLVGRGAERSRLATIWHAATGGRAQFVLVSGEPGVGKTRLVEDFRSWCAQRGAITVEARSYPAEGVLAYGPVVTWLRAEPIKARLERLDKARQTELVRLIPELLTAMPDIPRPEPLPEGDQRFRLFDAIARALFAPGDPLLLVADNLHWCDQETLHFLHYLLRAEPAAPLLVTATASWEDVDEGHPLHELVAGLQELERYAELPLGRLTLGETSVLAGRLAARPLTEAAIARLYRETEGNALFVVEALRAGWTGEPDDDRWMTRRVQTVIASRLARLSNSARELIGVAATIGRAFTTEVLVEAGNVDTDSLVHALDDLWRRRIIREQGADAYDFSHDKIREVAYRSLSPALRRRNHLRVALALERFHRDNPGPVSGQVAAHFERAGAVDQAVTWYPRAAAAAQQVHANVEAIRLLYRALDLLRALPETTECQSRELDILTALPALLGWVDGWASERLDAVHRRALDLVRMLGVEPAPQLLRSLAIASLARRDFAAARGFAERLHARGASDTDDMLLVEAAYVLGIAAFWQGELVAARGHFETAVDRYHPEHRREHLLRYGLDPKVICLSRLANTLWLLGHPGAATRARDAALALANEVGHPYSRAVALVFAAALSLDMRDADGVRAYVAMVTAEYAKHEMRPNQVAAEHFWGYVDVLDGRAALGIARIQRTLDESLRGDHAPGMRAFSVRVLLEAHALAGDARAGLAAADWALGLGSDDRIWEAETRRHRAEFLAALGSPAKEVEAELERALAVARRQGARMYELRAAVSLLRHRLARGDEPGADQARECLTAMVDALAEGWDSPDLREAAMLLGRG